MVTNTFSVIIDGINLTKNAVFPLKSANLLDERLDEAYLSLRHTRLKEVQPCTRVQIIKHNKVHYRDNVIYNADESVEYIVINDNMVEKPIGSGLYNHDIYLMELTKLLEMTVVESLTFTNDLGKSYTKAAQTASSVLTTPNLPNESDYLPSGRTFSVVNSENQWTTPSDFLSPSLVGSTFTVPSWESVQTLPSFTDRTTKIPKLCGFSIKLNGNTVYDTNNLTSSYSFTLAGGSYEIEYRQYWKVSGNTSSDDTYNKAAITYTIIVVSNEYPLKRLTCKDVVNRLLQLAEPLRLGETPRFTLSAAAEKTLDRIYAPQLSFTRQTLRECLQEVGKVVHGEPRLNPDNSIIFDFYGGTKRSFVGQHANIYSSSSQQIEQFCSSVDSTAQNMVNQTDWAAGVITEPDNYYFKTVRTETQYVRITDSNMLIATERPIYQLPKEKGLVVLIQNGSGIVGVDLTPYVVESTIYNSQLSSYSDAYPYSKAYGIYFTQGQKNIQGLNFKQDAAFAPEFQNYAIVNIIKRACAAQGITWTPPEGQEYANLAFQVSYVPYFDIRVSQSKPYYKDYKSGYALIYNQSANTIESRYYGENLKGAVARLGNPEKTITYNLTRLSQIPKAGELYDDDYYISAVTTEFLPTYIKCVVALSKDFNRLSQFIGISSEKRYYEISEKQTLDRSTLYKDYIVIGDEEESDSRLIGEDFMAAVADTFTQTGNYRPLTRVTAWGGTYENPVSVTVNGQTQSPLPCVQLSVVSVAIGNSMCFMWNYKDNYSAGSASEYISSGGVSGYWQNDYQYTDYYGKMYYYNFDVTMPENTDEAASSYNTLIQRGRELPASSFPSTRSAFISTQSTPFQYRKDSREVPQFNIQVEFVTNRRNLIIGSALASSCGLIRGTDNTLAAKLYVLDSPINKFTTVLNATPEFVDKPLPQAVDITVTQNGRQFYIESGAFPNAGKAWAIVTNQTETSETVEDDEGNITTQSIYKGGEVLLACNGDFAAGDNIGKIYFTAKSDVYRPKYIIIFSGEKLVPSSLPPSPKAEQNI